MNKTISIAVVTLVLGIGIGYVMHPASAAQGNRGNFAGARGLAAANGARGFCGGQGAGGGFLTGTVEKKDDGSITLNTRDGSSRVVLITPATSVSKSVIGDLSDVSVGASVMVAGTTNGDGSLSATMIQLRPDTNSGIAPRTGQ